MASAFEQRVRAETIVLHDGKAPIDFRATFAGHKDVARACLQRMQAWQPERIVMAHGRWYDKDGGEELARAFRWLR